MDVLIAGIQTPLILNKINCGLRFVSIATAAGIPVDNITSYDPGVIVNLDYLEQEYFKIMYPYHPIEPEGYSTVHPIDSNSYAEMKDENYFIIMNKLYKYGRLIYDLS